MSSKFKLPKLQTAATAIALVLASAAMVGCTTTGPTDRTAPVASSSAIDADVMASLTKLYDTVPGSRQLVAQAKGVLVFPSVLSASFGIGAQYGRGSLRVGNRTDSYYSTTAGSVGWQAGAQSKAVVYLFMTQDALDKFRNSSGWTAGADATVALANIGANGSVDTETVRQPVIGFVMTNVGLAAGVSVQGAKISRISM